MKLQKPPEPTTEQLAAAKEACAKFGAAFYPVSDSRKKQTNHYCRLPSTTTNADLKGLPDLPFNFTLNLNGTQVNDAGLPELKELKHLTGLLLEQTKVTGVGL